MNARSTAVTLLPWLLCLLLVGLPRSGWAAADAPLKSSSSLLDEEPDNRPERYRAPRGLRLLAEVGAGTVTAAAGGVVGSLLGAGPCLLLGVGRQAPLLCVIAGLVGAVAGLTEGYALGVWWGGELTGGDGSLLLTMLGATSGLALGLAAAYLYAVHVSNTFYPLIVPLPVMLGAHLGYELFQRAPVASLQPAVALVPGGATLGLSGRF